MRYVVDASTAGPQWAARSSRILSAPNRKVIAMALPVTRRRERLIPTQWGAFPEFEELYDRMGRLLESAFGEPIISPTTWTPFADLLEDDKSYIVEAEVPGMSKDDINIQVSGTSDHLREGGGARKRRGARPPADAPLRGVRIPHGAARGDRR